MALLSALHNRATLSRMGEDLPSHYRPSAYERPAIRRQCLRHRHMMPPPPPRTLRIPFELVWGQVKRRCEDKQGGCIEGLWKEQQTVLDASSYPLHSAQNAVAYGPTEYTQDPCLRRTDSQDACVVMRSLIPPTAPPSLRPSERAALWVQHGTVQLHRSAPAYPLPATGCSHAPRSSTRRPATMLRRGEPMDDKE